MRRGLLVLVVVAVGFAGCDDGGGLASPRSGEVVTVVENAGIDAVGDMAVGPDGTIYVTGRGITAWAPDGERRSVYSPSDELLRVSGIALGAGVVYASHGADGTVREISRTGGVRNIAGNGEHAVPPDGAPAAHSPLACPRELFYDKARSELSIRDGMDVRVLNDRGIISTGFGTLGKTVDELCAIKSYGLAIAEDGQYLFARPTFVARCCNDIVFYPPEGNDASPRPFDEITAMAYDPRSRTIYVADGGRLKRIAPDGTIGAVAGTGADLGDVHALAVDGKGNLWFVSGRPAGIRVIGAPVR